jgi:hypothetical protein
MYTNNNNDYTHFPCYYYYYFQFGNAKFYAVFDKQHRGEAEQWQNHPTGSKAIK